jgi:hypothetical protein
MIDTTTQQTNRQHGSAFVRLARGVYGCIAIVFVGAIIVQVFLAGAGALVHPRYWPLHTAWGHIIQVFPIIMLPLGVLARLPWRMLGLTALVFVLFMLQYVFLWILPNVAGVPALRALHAVNALAFFWIVVYLAHHTWQLLHAPRAPVRGDPQQSAQRTRPANTPSSSRSDQ